MYTCVYVYILFIEHITHFSKDFDCRKKICIQKPKGKIMRIASPWDAFETLNAVLSMTLALSWKEQLKSKTIAGLNERIYWTHSCVFSI